MSESRAEQLDESKLGEAVGDDELPSDDYPNDAPLAVADETITRDDGARGGGARNDVAARDARRSDDARPRSQSPGLIETTDDPDVIDDEQELIAERGDREAAPEAAAVRVIDAPETTGDEAG